MKFLRLVILAVCAVACRAEAAKTVLRVGHFPNITHPQGLIGHALSRTDRKWFEERLGPEVEVQWFVYKAGPSAMEAMLAGTIDITYVGPNPAVNAYLRTEGEDIRILCGSCNGGAALIVQPDGRIAKDSDFRGKKIATPQLGNTQDVAARTWLRSKGLRIVLTGGDAEVIPTANADQLVLFKQKRLDAVWTVEPWVTRLLQEADGRIYFEEKTLWPETGGKYVTTHLVARARFLARHRDLLKKWVAAHVELTQWILDHPDESRKLANSEMKAETSRPMADKVLDEAWKRLEPTWDPVSPSLAKSAEAAYRLGFLRNHPDLRRIYQLDLLNEVLREKGLKEVK